MSITKLIKCVACLLTVFPFLMSAQDNPEVRYSKMKEAAFNGQYESAKATGKALLAELPDFHDAAVMLARVYIWQQQYDSAKTIISDVLLKSPGYPDAVEADFDLAFFSGDMQKVASIGDTLASQNPTRTDILEKLAIAHYQLGDNVTAAVLANNLLSANPENKVASDILEKISPQPKPMELTLGYSFDHFKQPYNRWWHLYTVGIAKPYQWGSLAGRVNVGHLNAQGIWPVSATELQFEVESNFKLSKQIYAMLMYGYSSGIYFPTHKASTEVWHLLPHQMVVSAGLNFYYYSKPIYIATVSLEKYWSNYWFCLRNYMHFKDIGITPSFYFTARRYFNDVDYLQATIGAGAAPDEPFDIKTDLERQNAYSFRMAYLKQIAAKTKLRVGAGYAYEEYAIDTYRNRIDGTLSLIYSLGR
jgi:YaiO family outer membrane protein